ncbi:hypothetical protein [Caldovatus aquaticus]|uniref:DUF4190 domain-containing protein n=1 Tax=Caldovatus aquaticus TaxID=2865671 RepID=A0ABS7F7F0_9PROT|nr:hypothetical protein [Caldovatus aquaticus]MBW8270877.1 hypothetical protein [Caldovatus aquaticus]
MTDGAVRAAPGTISGPALAAGGATPIPRATGPPPAGFVPAARAARGTAGAGLAAGFAGAFACTFADSFAAVLVAVLAAGLVWAFRAGRAAAPREGGAARFVGRVVFVVLGTGFGLVFLIVLVAGAPPARRFAVVAAAGRDFSAAERSARGLPAAAAPPESRAAPAAARWRTFTADRNAAMGFADRPFVRALLPSASTGPPVGRFLGLVLSFFARADAFMSEPSPPHCAQRANPAAGRPRPQPASGAHGTRAALSLPSASRCLAPWDRCGRLAAPPGHLFSPFAGASSSSPRRSLGT